MKKAAGNTLQFALGVVVPWALTLTGLMLAHLFDSELPLILFLLCVPFLILFSLIKRKKPLSIGLIISSIPLSIVVYIFYEVSQLH